MHHFEKALIAQCAPTLAGLKTANLFRHVFAGNTACARHTVRRYNAILKGKGLALLLLRQSAASCLVLVYRPALLRRDLRRPESIALLREGGYLRPENMHAALRELCRRIRCGQGFPHEVGLFLGYPIADVRGFIRHNGRGYCLCGCWKVYQNPEEAKRTFYEGIALGCPAMGAEELEDTEFLPMYESIKDALQ
ncbi:MAG: DUF3793 family protein, partial [Clostridiales bacterium]|nr:DUF3793 family protein [Clostridiales bacterium]